MKHHFLLRIGLLFVLTMLLMSSNAFTLTGRYTTVVEDRYPLHYIKFEKAERGILQVMRYNFNEKEKDEYAFTFSILNDTITIVPTNWIDTTYNATFKRLAAAKFVSERTTCLTFSRDILMCLRRPRKNIFLTSHTLSMVKFTRRRTPKCEGD